MDPQIKYLQLQGAESSRLLMKLFSLSDAEDMFEYTSNPECCKFLNREPQTNISETREFLESVDKRKNNPDDINWGLYLKETDKLIGSIHIYNIDIKHESVMMSYILNPAFERKGYMSECITAAINACSSFLGTKIIRCIIADENIGSVRMAEKCGMIPDVSVEPWYSEVKGKHLRVQKYVYLTDTDGRE